ncbi:hypothetical protein ACH4D5_04670 [Streptomyces sp. NPDC018029]|uniref:hypothetical protein n=1 Tax=Streptomyces sp. NPDC018029 TaxID=3365032 RepID=UPI0037906638
MRWRESLLHPGCARWISMAEALGWGAWKPHPPANSTVGVAGGRAERTVHAEHPTAQATPTAWRWTLRSNNQAHAAEHRPGTGSDSGHRRRGREPADLPRRTTPGRATRVGKFNWLGERGRIQELSRLEALSDRLVLAGGEDARGELPYRTAAFLAERLGTELLRFPGGHTGLTTYLAAFVERMAKALRASRCVRRRRCRRRRSR